MNKQQDLIEYDCFTTNCYILKSSEKFEEANMLFAKKVST